jgi:hypothetical protein
MLNKLSPLFVSLSIFLYAHDAENEEVNAVPAPCVLLIVIYMRGMCAQTAGPRIKFIWVMNSAGCL